MDRKGQMYILHLLAKERPRTIKEQTIRDYCINMILWDMKIKSIEEKFKHGCKN